MLLQIYTVKDAASETYLKPFMFQTDRDAIEGFRHVCNEPETPYAKHPADFDLISLGCFNVQSGRLEVSDPKTIARALNMITTKEQ